MNTVAKRLSFLEGSAVRRELQKNTDLGQDFDVVFTILPSGLYYITKNKLNDGQTDNDVLLTREEFMELTKEEWVTCHDLRIFFPTEQQIYAHMKGLEGKHWINPSTATIFEIGEYTSPKDPYSDVGRVKVKEVKDMEWRDVTSNAIMFDYIYESGRFFPCHNSAYAELANVWRCYLQIEEKT